MFLCKHGKVIEANRKAGEECKKNVKIDMGIKIYKLAHIKNIN
jgi:hypothetical protein